MHACFLLSNATAPTQTNCTHRRYRLVLACFGTEDVDAPLAAAAGAAEGGLDAMTGTGSSLGTNSGRRSSLSDCKNDVPLTTFVVATM